MGRGEKREPVKPARPAADAPAEMAVPTRLARQRLATEAERRERLAEHLKDNPGLKVMLPEAFTTAHRPALPAARRETGLPAGVFPPACPYTPGRAFDGVFLPGEA